MPTPFPTMKIFEALVPSNYRDPATDMGSPVAAATARSGASFGIDRPFGVLSLKLGSEPFDRSSLCSSHAIATKRSGWWIRFQAELFEQSRVSGQAGSVSTRDSVSSEHWTETDQ
jgi:hypothetical protein